MPFVDEKPEESFYQLQRAAMSIWFQRKLRLWSLMKTKRE